MREIWRTDWIGTAKAMLHNQRVCSSDNEVTGSDINVSMLMSYLRWFVMDCFVQGTSNAVDGYYIFVDMDWNVHVVAMSKPNTYIKSDPDYSGA